ncbi:hypothetical protein RRG08_045120 [Elysia crispata]|uniref:Uncharacterized protein n=1 Tax=Elysia crispata TaxID=231223 RepID=A0AAE0YSW6_9GAST|nr:hypothetical protein RRG08_045120 [Elysia crispata]
MFSVLKLKSPRDLFSSSTQQTFAWSLFKQDWKISLEPVIHLSSNQLIKTKPTPLELRLAVAASSNESQKVNFRLSSPDFQRFHLLPEITPSHM